MNNSWRTWCRLCANENSTVGLFITTEDSHNIVKLVQEFLQITIDPLADVPQTICELCYKFLVTIVEFRERVIKVEAMYASIVNSDANPVDCADWRVQFGLLDGELSPYCPAKVDPSGDDAKFLSYCPGENEPADDGSNSNIELFQMDCKIENEAVVEDNIEAKFNPSMVESVPVEQFTDDQEDTSDVDFKQNIDSNEANLDTNTTQIDLAITKDTKTPKKVGRKRREPPFKCIECDMIYRSYNQLRYHKSTTHYIKRISCRYCDKKFSSKTAAQEHEIAHLDPDKKPAIPCPQCERSYTKLSNLYLHIRANHSGERAFICDTCGKSFATNGGLKEHKVIHNEERPYPCPLCPKKFKALEGLKRHEDSHGEKKYPCPECGLVLNTKQTLRTHKVVHSDERKFKCSVCGSGFKRSKNLKTHMVTHTGLRPHPCPYCDKAFAEAWECRRHVKKAHPQEVYPEAVAETE